LDGKTLLVSDNNYNIVNPYTIPGRHGRHKIIPQKNAKNINKFINYFVEINKIVNKNYRQKTKENM
jgi:hypothetical protein